MRTKIRIIACLSMCGILLLPAFVNALPVKINPGRFQGKWHVGTSNIKTGPATLDLFPGQTYHLDIEQVGNLPFTVLSDGTVSSDRPASAIGSGNTLTLKTIPVHVKPGQFPVAWHLPSISTSKIGPGAVTLVPGLTYELSFEGMGSFLFTILADGTVLSHRPEAAKGSGNTLTFKTTRVTVNPGNFPVSWYIQDISTPHQGQNTLDLMPGLTYDLSISNIGGFQFSVSDNGFVNSLNPESATGKGNILSFKKTPVNIDPGKFPGAWQVLHISKARFGTGMTPLIPGLTYSLSLNEIGLFQFDVKADGSILSRHPESATGSGNTLTLNTSPVRIKQDGPLHSWAIPWVPVGLTPDTVDLVPGFTYTLFSKGKRGQFNLEGPCTVTPETLVLNKSTFHIVCTGNLNKPPIAVPGLDQKITLGKTAFLDGSNSSDPDGDPIFSYQWSIDSTPSGSKNSITNENQANAMFTPDKSGNYLFSLRVNDGKLNSSVKTLRLSVRENPVPTIKASATPDSGPASLEVLFDGIASSSPEGGALDYAWNFGDPNSGIDNMSTLASTRHVYQFSGNYTAALTVSNRLGQVSNTTFNIHVTGPNLPPTAVLSALPRHYQNPLSIQFTAEASDPEGEKLSYHWDFGDGSERSTKDNPVHQYGRGGSYDIRLLVSDGFHTVEVTNRIDVTSPMEIRVQKINGRLGKGENATSKVKLDVGFSPGTQISDRDLVKVVFDQTTLFEIPFGQFIEMHDTPGKFMYKAKNLKVRIDLKKGLLQVIRKEVDLNNVGGRKELQLRVIFGQMAGAELVYYNGATLSNQSSGEK